MLADIDALKPSGANPRRHMQCPRVEIAAPPQELEGNNGLA